MIQWAQPTRAFIFGLTASSAYSNFTKSVKILHETLEAHALLPAHAFEKEDALLAYFLQENKFMIAATTFKIQRPSLPKSKQPCRVEKKIHSQKSLVSSNEKKICIVLFY